MRITIKRTNNKELRSRKERLYEELGINTAYIDDGETLLTRTLLTLLAHGGCLSLYERELYDELRRVEILLGDD